MNDAQKCRRNGWKAGTRLRGLEGGKGWYRLTTIEITAVGERNVLAKVVAETCKGCEPERNLGWELSWTLFERNWRKVR